MNTTIQNKTQSEKLSLIEVIAMGVGGMVGGGIFSVLGLAILLAGHAAPVAFALCGVIALITGISYGRLGLLFHSDGGSFTYLEHAFEHTNIAGIGGWLLLVGYIATMSLYAFTFGVYGTAMFGLGHEASGAMQHLLESLIILVFLAINLYGVKASGKSELIIVTIKILILLLFAIVGLFYAQPDHLLPIFNQGIDGVLMGAALIFVAYEGFELIPNTINEMEDPQTNLMKAIIWSICITISVYVLVSIVAVGNLLPEQINQYKEYALAVAAKPFLGQAGFMLIGLAALFSASSAINATLFGTARLSMVMASENSLPTAFGFRRQSNNIPWAALIIISLMTLIFVNLANLNIISSFASSTFLLIFTLINLSAWRLRKQLKITAVLPVIGMVLSMISWFALLIYLWQSKPSSLIWIAAIYLTVICAELIFSQRRCIFKARGQVCDTKNHQTNSL